LASCVCPPLTIWYPSLRGAVMQFPSAC